MIVEKLELILSANTSNLTNGISKAKGALSDLPKQTGKTTSGMLSAFSAFKGGMMALGLGGLFVGIGKTITKSIGGAIGRVDTMNNFSKVMGNLGIESKSADASIKRLSDKLTGLPTTLDSATLSVQRLTASNGNIGASTEMFLAMNNAILAGGADMQIQQSALEQLIQAYSKGKPDMMEWRTLLTAMPAQLKQVAIAMGYASADQLGVALRSGAVSMNDFMAKMVELNKNGANGFKSFEEQARGATGGIQTSMMNVKTAITRGIADIINAIGQANIASFFNGITRAINATIPYIVGFVKVVVSAIGMLTSLFGGKATKNQSSQTKNIQKSAGALNNVKSSGIGASKGIDKAGKSAKKLKKELNGIAAFDEMNILTEAKTPDTSSSGAGGGGGVGDMGNIQPLNFDTSGVLGGMKNIKSKADEIADKIKKAFRNIWDTTPMQNFIGAMTSFKDQAINFFSVVGGTAKENLTNLWTDISPLWQSSMNNLSGLWSQFWLDVQTTNDENAPIITEKFNNLFSSLTTGIFMPAVTLLSQVWDGFTKVLKELWDENGKDTLESIATFVKKTIDLAQTIYDSIIEPIVKPLFAELTEVWDKYGKDALKSVYGFVMKLFNYVLFIYNKVAQPAINFLLKVLAPAWAYMSTIVIGTLGNLLKFIWGFVGGILKALGGLIDFTRGIFTGNWRLAWNGVKSIFSGVFSSLTSIVKFAINSIINSINGLFAGLNKVKVPDFVPKIGGRGFSIPRIPKLARGGIVDRPTAAIFGEAGREAVVPLERNTEWIDKLATKINVASGGQPVNLVVKLGEETIFKKFVDFQKDKQFESNGDFVFA